MTSATDRGASVRLLPPLVFLAPLLAGILLDRLVPWRLPSTGSWPVVLTTLGATLLLAGLALMTWAVVVMLRHRTTVIPWAKVDQLVTGGPFRLARNPIYVGDALVYLGVSLIAGTWWPLLLLPLPVFVMQRFVIVREEAYLLELFGASYAGYCARVRRWGVV